jgi:hypothetical protein
MARLQRSKKAGSPPSPVRGFKPKDSKENRIGSGHASEPSAFAEWG